MIKYKGAVVWNALPNELQTITSLSIFKRNYKSYLINSYFAICSSVLLYTCLPVKL